MQSIRIDLFSSLSIAICMSMCSNGSGWQNGRIVDVVFAPITPAIDIKNNSLVNHDLYEFGDNQNLLNESFNWVIKLISLIQSYTRSTDEDILEHVN